MRGKERLVASFGGWSVYQVDGQGQRDAKAFRLTGLLLPTADPVASARFALGAQMIRDMHLVCSDTFLYMSATTM